MENFEWIYRLAYVIGGVHHGSLPPYLWTGAKFYLYVFISVNPKTGRIWAKKVLVPDNLHHKKFRNLKCGDICLVRGKEYSFKDKTLYVGYDIKKIGFLGQAEDAERIKKEFNDDLFYQNWMDARKSGEIIIGNA